MIWDKGRGIRTKRTCFFINYICVTVLCVVCSVFSENSQNNSCFFIFFSGIVNRALATVLCIFFATAFQNQSRQPRKHKPYLSDARSHHTCKDTICYCYCDRLFPPTVRTAVATAVVDMVTRPTMDTRP